MKTVLYRLYKKKNKILRKVIRIIISKLENGEIFSQTLRKIYKDYHNIDIGMYSYGGCFIVGNIPPGTKIGRYGSFARFMIFPRNHPIDFVSTHPFFFNTKLGYLKEEIIKNTKLEIGNDVWIGENAFIMSKVQKIGNGAIIGAGSVVTKDVPPYAIVVGNPAKVLKYRFSNEIINEIEKSKWWDKDISDLEKDIHLFMKPYRDTRFFASR